VATLRLYSSRPAGLGGDEIKKTGLKWSLDVNRSFPQAATQVRSRFLIWHVFGLVMHSAVFFKKYPSGLCGIFDSLNK
jgi:hypothetical protein